MPSITRGTTPTLQILLPTGMTTDDVAELWLTISRGCAKIINKTMADCTAFDDGTGFDVMLTQEETLALTPAMSVSIQARLRTIAGDAIATEVYTVSVGRILKDGVI